MRTTAAAAEAALSNRRSWGGVRRRRRVRGVKRRIVVRSLAAQLVAIRRECAELAIEIELVDAIAIGGGEVLGEPLPPFMTFDAAPS